MKQPAFRHYQFKAGGKPYKTRIDFGVDASFEKGDAKIFVQVVPVGDSYLMHGIRFSSDALYE